MTSLEAFLIGMVTLLTVFVLKLTMSRLEMGAALDKMRRRNRELKTGIDKTYDDLLRIALRLGRYHNHGIEERPKANSKDGGMAKFFCVQTSETVLLYEYTQRHEDVFKNVPVFQKNTAPKRKRAFKLVK